MLSETDVLEECKAGVRLNFKYGYPMHIPCTVLALCSFGPAQPTNLFFMAPMIDVQIVLFMSSTMAPLPLNSGNLPILEL